MHASAEDDTARRPRRKEKTKRAKDAKGRKLSHTIKSKRLTETVEDGLASQRVGVDDRDSGNHDDVECGISQEKIFQLRPLDVDDDDEAFGRGLDLRSSFFGHDPLADGTDSSTTWYVEHEVSGEFFRVRRRRDRIETNELSRSKTSRHRMKRRHHQLHHAIEGDIDTGVTSALFSTRIAYEIEAALGMLGHGIVVGLSWMDAFNLGVTRDRFVKDESTRMRFICTYSGMADRSRQLFFLLFKYPPLRNPLLVPSIPSFCQSLLNPSLCTFSLLSLMRKISRVRMQHQLVNEDRRLQRFRVHSLRLLQGAFACAATALLVLLVASPSALRLATAFAQDPNWCERAVEKSASSALSRLQQCAAANAVLLSLGWLLVCIQCNLGMSSHLSLRRRLVEAYAVVDQLELRTDHLDGRALDGLSIDTLKALLQQHRRAVEATESVLVTKLQMQNPTGIQAASSWAGTAATSTE